MIQHFPGASQIFQMVSEQIPRRYGWSHTTEQSLILKIDDTSSIRPVDMAVGTVVAVSTFVVDVNADGTALDDLDHACTLPPSQDIVKAKIVQAERRSAAESSSILTYRK